MLTWKLRLPKILSAAQCLHHLFFSFVYSKIVMSFSVSGTLIDSWNAWRLGITMSLIQRIYILAQGLSHLEWVSSQTGRTLVLFSDDIIFCVRVLNLHWYKVQKFNILDTYEQTRYVQATGIFGFSQWHLFAAEFHNIFYCYNTIGNSIPNMALAYTYTGL